MTWTFTHDLDAFLATAGPALAAHPAENTVLLTVTEGLRRRGLQVYGDGSPLFGWWRAANGAVSGTVAWTPPYPLQVGVSPTEAVRPLADALEQLDVTVVNAERSVGAALTARWPTAVTEEQQLLYRLGDLTPPQPMPLGAPRDAGAGDRALLMEWYTAFGRETGQPAPAEGAVDDRLSYGGLVLWEIEGCPVSLAGCTRPTAGSVRVAPVYTPPEQRGRGYAAAVTAEVSRAALDAGAAEVLLFTDLANATSNGVYRRIGFRPIADRVVVSRG
ncbi:GNAT family N-acetyltransferase [Streptomyces sp. NPDC051322]|uniref:GNAT family N-acetyltransferase n=1 Tax=Streptomyces sp. NPDC051322 TaxID=3154645 RepID=UPI00344FF07F